MAIYHNTSFYEDNLQKRYCNNCFKEFITGEELATTVPYIVCPYCGSSANEVVAGTDDDMTRALDLGCTGIYFHKKNNAYYDVCIVCRERLTRKNIHHQSCCKKCAERQ